MDAEAHIERTRLLQVATTVGYQFTDDEMTHLCQCRLCLDEFSRIVLDELRSKRPPDSGNQPK
jgi:hypothetical protein